MIYSQLSASPSKQQYSIPKTKRFY